MNSLITTAALSAVTGCSGSATARLALANPTTAPSARDRALLADPPLARAAGDSVHATLGADLGAAIGRAAVTAPPLRPAHRLMKTLILSSMIGATACAASGGTAAELPLIVPPVRAATPSSFQAAAHAARRAAADGGLSAGEFRDRFFNPAGGPTEVFQILDGIDARLAEINAAGSDPRPCLEQVPVTYTLSVFGQAIPFAAQCYRRFGAATPGGPAAFMQFGKLDGITYLFVTGGAARVAARVAPVAGTSDVQVDAWYGVGYANSTCGTDGTFDGCSYAATEIHADPSTHAFEMAVAGIGVGFCGVSMRSDGASIYGAGSTDMGATCRDRATLCVSASDLTAPGACDAITSFTVPALGRKAGAGAHEFGASGYPDIPNLTLDGTATDSLGFGPATAPTLGVGDFDAP